MHAALQPFLLQMEGLDVRETRKKEQFFPRKSPPIFSALHRFCADVGQYYEDAKGYEEYEDPKST